MSREAMQMALDALESLQAWPETPENFKRFRAIEALRARLAQPDVPETAFGETEPVAWISHNAGLYHGKPDESLNPLPLYTAPPQREWVGLTDEEINTLHYELKCAAMGATSTLGMYRILEKALKEKNHDNAHLPAKRFART